MRLVLIAAACFSAFATGALAQPASPEARQVQAQQMIANANAADIFVFEDHPPAVAIRHPRSGLLCRFGAGATAQEVSIVPSTSFGIPHGDDVACSNRMQMGTFTIYATRRSDVPDADHALAEAVNAIQTMNPGAQPVTLHNTDTATLDGRPLPEGSRTAAFTIAANGQQLFTRVSVYMRDGWVYKLRFTSPTQRANILADMAWAGTLTDLPPLAENPN